MENGYFPCRILIALLVKNRKYFECLTVRFAPLIIHTETVRCGKQFKKISIERSKVKFLCAKRVIFCGNTLFFCVKPVEF